MRALTAVTAIVGLALTLAGCARSDGKVHVTYWEKWTGAEAEAMQTVVDAFNRSQNGIVVEYLSVSNVDQKTLVATAGGDPPDVAGLWVQNVYSSVDHDALTPLDDFIHADGMTSDQWLARYYPVFADICTYKGKIWAVPSTPGLYALHWNKAMFRAAGLDPDRPPRTVQELDEFSDRLTKIDPKTGQIVQLGFLPQEPGWIAWAFPQWFGGRLWDGRNITLDRYPENRAAFDWVAGYSKRYGLDKIRAFTSGFGGFASPQNAFFDGKIAMVFQGVWTNNYARQFAPGLEYGVAPIPTAKLGLERFAVADADLLMIPRGAKHAKEAWEFLRFVSSHDQNAKSKRELSGMELLCYLQQKASPLVEWSPYYTEHNPHPYIGFFRDLATSPNAIHQPKIGIWQEYNREINSVFENVRLLDKTPAQALQFAQKRMAESWKLHSEALSRRTHDESAGPTLGSNP
jgi:ABC-type glycerol-3-phosphate transport system substrate-binding protein